VILGDFHLLIAADALKFNWRYSFTVSVSAVSDFGLPPIDEVTVPEF
jgi:hypothetical protein